MTAGFAERQSSIDIQMKDEQQLFLDERCGGDGDNDSSTPDVSALVETDVQLAPYVGGLMSMPRVFVYIGLLMAFAVLLVGAYYIFLGPVRQAHNYATPTPPNATLPVQSFTTGPIAQTPSSTPAEPYTCSANELSSTSVTVVQLTRAEDLPCWLSPKNKYWAWFHDTLCQQPNTLYLLRSNSTHLLVSCFSNVFGGPLWVVEPPATVRESDSCANKCDCPTNFLTNGQGIPSTVNGRSFQPFTYQGSPLGMDRGHLSPKGDYFCCTTNRLSCHVINRAPQYNKVNSGKWNQVEQTVRRVELQNGPYVPFIFTYLLYPSDWSNYRTPEKDSGFNTAVPLNFTKVIYSDMQMTQAMCIVQDNLPDKANNTVATRYLTWADCPSALKSRFLPPQTLGDSFYRTVIAARS